MPSITRPGGATIHYEVAGSGYPLLLIAPGGVSSEIGFWDRSLFNPMRELADEFMVIGMDQRHAGTSWAAAEPFSYDDCVGDQLAVLDACGVDKAHMMGGCIGCAHIWRFAATAPGRVSAAVCQNPVGLDGQNSIDVFYAMFGPTMEVARASGMDAVIEAALADAIFVVNNAGGPFSARIAGDPAFREEIRAMAPDAYIDLILAFREGIWPDYPPYFTVSDEWMRACPVPMLVLPGNDPFHPRAIARRIAETAPDATFVDGPWSTPEEREATIARVRGFLRSRTP